MFDFFELDYYFDDVGKQVFLLAKVYYKNSTSVFSASKVEYYFAHRQGEVFVIFEKGLVFDNDFDEFIFCYGEELGVPLRRECIRFETTST